MNNSSIKLQDRIAVAVLTDTGRSRTSNEDAIGYWKSEAASSVDDKGLLAIVADGLGGHRCGEVASVLALEQLRNHYFAAPVEPLPALSSAIESANRFVYEQSANNPECGGMGCACSALVVRERDAYFVHVGDTRLYFFRDGLLSQMTEDDTVVHDMVLAGKLKKEQEATHPDRHRLSRALGTSPLFSYQGWFSPFKLQPGDSFVLSSDGLHNAVSPADMAAIIKTYEPVAAVRRLAALANERDGSDNISVGIVTVKSVC